MSDLIPEVQSREPKPFIPTNEFAPIVSINKKKFDGPISSKMQAKLGKLNSSYADSFDWSIYDKLHARFGDNQPRGGVVFHTNFKLVNSHHECSKCHYSFEIDSYGRGCVHNCVYCYAKDQLTLKGYWNRPHPMPVDLAEIRKIFYTVFETDKRSKWRALLESRIPLRIGSMSDSFMWMDLKYRVSYELLKILRHYQYPYLIFTRSDLVAHDEYISLIDPKIGAVQFSISGNNEEMSRKIEPGAPNVARRLAALKKLNAAGISASVRINPLFPTFPDGYFSDREKTLERFNGDIPKFDFFDINRAPEFLDQLKSVGVKTFLAGFVRLNQTSISQISRATGVDFKQFFKPENYTNSGESHFSNEEIRHYYQVLAKEAQKSGLRFSTCYIGNGIKDYYQYQSLWTNKKDCCDVVGRVASFKKTSQDIPWEERFKHASNIELAKQSRALEERFDAAPKDESTLTANHGMVKLVNHKGIKWEPKSEFRV